MQLQVGAGPAAREGLRAALAARLRERFLSHYHANDSHEPYEFTPEAAGRRRLKKNSRAALRSVNGGGGWSNSSGLGMSSSRSRSGGTSI